MSNTWLMFTATDFGSASPQGWSLGGDREKMLWKRKRADWYPRVGSVEGMVGQGKWKTGMGEMGFTSMMHQKCVKKEYFVRKSLSKKTKKS